MNVALLIDCENANPESIDGILGELAEKGAINIRRAYGNWKNQAGWEEKLHPFAIQPVQQFAYTKGKNAVDMCMAIDARQGEVRDWVRRKQDAGTVQEGVFAVHPHRRFR